MRQTEIGWGWTCPRISPGFTHFVYIADTGRCVKIWKLFLFTFYGIELKRVFLKFKGIFVRVI